MNRSTRTRTTARVPQRRNGIARFNALLDASEVLIARMPVADISLNAIAEEAGVPRVSAYHFFPSVDAVMASLYDRYLEEMLSTSLRVDQKARRRWQTALAAMLRAARRYFDAHPAAMHLVLSPQVPKDMNAGNRRFGHEIEQWLRENFALEASRDLTLACEIVVELVDAVWSKSYQEHGRLTDRLFDEALKAATSYLGTCLPESLPSRAA
jgi:AcrR family transcriptional regulator